ncbi:MAG: FHA domain-containing protein [Caldilineaceae bacterium]|nr:FHA domain-containing protein [Caldilineaceae bacterium]MCB9155663.1 FHA domain-containing protein [Caldilineaceae bacterium]
MTLHQTDQTNVGRISQMNGNEVAQAAQPATKSVAAQNVAAKNASAVEPVVTPESQVGQTLDAAPSLPNVSIFASQNMLQSVLLSLVVLLSIVVIWLLRRPKQTADTSFQVLAAEPAIAPHRREPNAQQQPTLVTAKVKPSKAAALHLMDVDEEEDTSKPASTNRFEFEDEATFVFAPKAEERLLGHLIRVTDEPRFPAELELLSASHTSTDESQLAIGRHRKHNAVVIPDISVSRQHAMIVQRGEKLFVRDNGSTAGTLLNWKRVCADAEQPLRDKDILSFGEAVYEFHARSAAATDSPVMIHKFAQDDTEKLPICALAGDSGRRHQ